MIQSHMSSAHGEKYCKAKLTTILIESCVLYFGPGHASFII
jgi:hypothetical protein